jgi:hypothetical protein
MNFHSPVPLSAFVFLAALLIQSSSPAEEPKRDPQHPFRTDFANEQLRWYQLNSRDFPPHHSEHRVSGELVAADFIHRSGVFRKSGSGELVNFTLPPFGTVHYRNAPADLRDVPLGTGFVFFLYQDTDGVFTRAAALQDDFTTTAKLNASYRLDAIKRGEGKLMVTRQKLPAKQADGPCREWLVTEHTRLWKGGQSVKLDDLAAGDELLANFAAATPEQPLRCTEIWIGADTHQQVTQEQREKHSAFLKVRGLPARIHRVEGSEIVADLLASDDPADRTVLRTMVLADFSVGKDMRLAVANDELRTYWPSVDGKRARVVRIENTPADAHGTGGLRITLEPTLMLEGFRQGRIVRLFGEKWPVHEHMPLGEGLQVELTSAEVNELAPKEYPAQFPYRTDYGNASLPWYQLKAGEIPPRWSEHRVYGELTKVDAVAKAGQFRTDRTGELVDFTLTAEGALVYINTNKPDNTGPVRWDSLPASVLYLNTPCSPEDLPLGLRCCFHLYQDERGAFTRASLITDEFSQMAVNKVSWRIETLKLEAGRIEVVRCVPPRKQLRSDGYDHPPAIGRAELSVDASTRIWKGAGQLKLAELSPGDELLVNLAGETASTFLRCTDIWANAEAQGQATEQQRKQHEAKLKMQKPPQTR